MQAHRYIIARYFDGTQVGVNSKVATIAKGEDSTETNVQSFRPRNFNEYITFKAPTQMKHYQYIYQTKPSGRVLVEAESEEQANNIIATSRKYTRAKFVGKQLKA